MDKFKERTDDFQIRRKHIKQLSDAELKIYFWKLADQAVNPLIDLAKTHTSPAIERSVLLRMGFSSLEAKVIVDKVIDASLMGKGAGHVVYRYAQLSKQDIRIAGLQLIDGIGWDIVIESFGGNKSC
jgi:D-ornithine 4,5-aminomutase subunit alpha